MSWAEQQRALERAAAPALAAIKEDSGRAPKWLRPLFEAAADLLFDPDLDLDRVREAAGFADPEVWNALREVVGQPPWSYLRDARLETAARLLLEADVSVSKAGRLVGYDGGPSFRGRLGTFLGMPPSRYRRRARRRLERAGAAPAGAETVAYWQRMLAGELQGDEARQLDAYLGRLAPASAPAANPADERWARLRRDFAEGLVETLDQAEAPEDIAWDENGLRMIPQPDAASFELCFADQRRLVRDAVRFPGDAFRALGRRGEGADPERGVELALLALDSLASGGMLETDPGLAALGRARLARARWRAGDLEGAASDLERSRLDAERGGEEPALQEAERYRVAAAFDWLRGRRRQALALADRSVTAYRTVGDPAAGVPAAGDPAAGDPGLAAALTLRAELRAAAADLEPANAGTRARELRRALTDLEEAGELAAGTPAAGARPRGERKARVSLEIRLLAAIGTRAEIAAALPALRQAADGLGRGLAARLTWLEGHAAGTAGGEAAWREARERFAELEDDVWTARATLDLARLCLAEGRPGEAAALASELAATLGADDDAVLEPLRRAAPFTEVAAGDLERAEKVLAKLEWRRRARRALDLAR